MSSVSLTPETLREFRQIVEYLRERNPPAARQVAEALLAGLDRLAQFPALGAIVATRDGIPIRQFVVSGYLIRYRPKPGGGVLVLRIRHGRQERVE